MTPGGSVAGGAVVSDAPSVVGVPDAVVVGASVGATVGAAVVSVPLSERFEHAASRPSTTRAVTGRAIRVRVVAT